MKLTLAPVFVISGKDPTVSPGGYAAYSHNLCKILTSLGHPVYVLAAGKTHEVKYTSIGEVHLVKNSGANAFPILGSVEMAMMPFYAYSFKREILSIISKQGYKEILLWGMGPWTFAGALVKKSHIQAKLFASYFTTFRHEMSGSLKSILTPDYPLPIKIKYILISFLGGMIFSQIERKTLQKTDVIITHYRSTEQILKREFSVHADKIKRISYYVEIFERSENSLYIPESQKKVFPKPIILSVCRQDARKGINFLLHAISLLNQRNIRCSCVIVGSGTLLNAHKKLAAELHLSNAYFLGYQTKIAHLYAQADVFALSSTEEGSGSLSLLEAMREGLPIVSTNCDGIGEDVKNNRSALLVDPASATNLATALQDLLNNQNKAKLLGQSAQQSYKEKFSFEKMKNDIKKLLLIV